MRPISAPERTYASLWSDSFVSMEHCRSASVAWEVLSLWNEVAAKEGCSVERWPSFYAAQLLEVSFWPTLIEIGGASQAKAFRPWVRILCDSGRLGWAQRLQRAILQEIARREGRELLAFCAATLPEISKRDAIVATLERGLGSKLEVDWREDPSLLGGFQLLLRGWTLDYSKRHAIHSLRSHLKKSTLHQAPVVELG